MQVMLVSSVEMARSQAQALRLRGLEIIATGIINNGNQQVVLIDVTPEVKTNQLDNRNLGLVDSFLRTHQSEILNQVQAISTAPQVMAAGAD